MSATTCRTCGEPVPAGMNFCRKCGTRLSDAGPAASGGIATPSGPQAYQAASTAPPVATQQFGTDGGDTRNENRRLVLIAVGALILTLIARLAYSAATSEPKAPGEIVAQLAAGPDGATKEFGDGGKIKVPKGALDRVQNITIRRAPVPDRIRVQSPNDGSPLIFPAGTVFVYIFEPIDLVFLRPVTITLPAPNPDSDLVFVSANGNIVFLSGSAGDGTITVRVTSFAFSEGRSVVVSNN